MSKTDFICEQLKRAIQRGDYLPGTALMSERELSDHFGVSRVTIRAALRKLETEKLVERRGTRGTYIREDLYNSERQGTVHQSIHLLYPQHHWAIRHDRFFSELVRHISAQLKNPFCHLMLTAVPPSSSVREFLLSPYSARFLAGVIIAHPMNLDGLMDWVNELDVACVFLGRHDAFPQLPFVESDHRRGVYEAVHHLAQHGYRRIALLTASANDFSMPQLQREGFLQALEECGLEARADLMPEVCMWDEDAACQIVCQWIRNEKLPDAVIAGSYETAIGIYRAVQQHA
ncbi:MAG: GntR family transcriptional regulator, partial [Lentisphaerae bacterium]